MYCSYVQKGINHFIEFYVLPTQCIYMCLVWISEQTAIIFLYSVNWLVFITETVYLLRGMDWVFNPLKPSGHYMYHQFNIQQFYVLPTQCIYVWIWEQTAIISLYSINWLVFITETVYLLRSMDWVFNPLKPSGHYM